MGINETTKSQRYFYKSRSLENNNQGIETCSIIVISNFKYVLDQKIKNNIKSKEKSRHHNKFFLFILFEYKKIESLHTSKTSEEYINSKMNNENKYLAKYWIYNDASCNTTDKKSS